MRRFIIWPSKSSLPIAISSVLGLALILSAMDVVSIKSIVDATPFRDGEVKKNISDTAGKIDTVTQEVWNNMKNVLFRDKDAIFENKSLAPAFESMENKMKKNKDNIYNNYLNSKDRLIQN